MGENVWEWVQDWNPENQPKNYNVAVHISATQTFVTDSKSEIFPQQVLKRV